MIRAIIESPPPLNDRSEPGDMTIHNVSSDALFEIADTAQDAGAAISRLSYYVAEAKAEMTALIAGCFSTSSALIKLAAAVGESPNLEGQSAVAAGDFIVVEVSLILTFSDMKRLVGGFRRSRLTTAVSYRQIWVELMVHFQRQSDKTLARRLKLYQQFVEGLESILING